MLMKIETAARRTVADINSCEFYHAVDLPNGEQVKNPQWDLRPAVDAYLGNVDFKDRRVLEIGPASGFLSFHMERCGARVVAVEPPLEITWDFIPRVDADLANFKTLFKEHVQRIRNGFWYLHALNRSAVEVYEASAYDLPHYLGHFDIGVLAAILLHTRSPLSIIEQVASIVRSEIVITELYRAELSGPVCQLVPGKVNKTFDTWWNFTPEFFQEFLAAVGFPHSTVTRHRQHYCAADAMLEMFTVVARRKPPRES
jgi:O-methyltransferase